MASSGSTSSSGSPRRLLRILCLSGAGDNASTFGRQCRPLAEALKDIAEFVFLSAPHPARIGDSDMQRSLEKMAAETSFGPGHVDPLVGMVAGDDSNGVLYARYAVAKVRSIAATHAKLRQLGKPVRAEEPLFNWISYSTEPIDSWAKTAQQQHGYESKQQQQQQQPAVAHSLFGGWDATIHFLRHHFATNAPYDGMLGFSQV